MPSLKIIDTPAERANIMRRDIYVLGERVRNNDFRDEASRLRAESTIENIQGQLAWLKRNFQLED
jgi:hypothetical protein